ncbi:MAG: hypothetical protein JJ891_16915 [Rhizobiaceae bacterium]|jgi:hypothetical protein|nr:hypothetical protein [Rhizobiaceae bacterium]
MTPTPPLAPDASPLLDTDWHKTLTGSQREALASIIRHKTVLIRNRWRNRAHNLGHQTHEVLARHGLVRIDRTCTPHTLSATGKGRDVATLLKCKSLPRRELKYTV